MSGEETNIVLSCEGVGKQYVDGETSNEVLRDVSFRAAEGELVSIVGASGCGKTTLLKIIAGLIPATEGRVLVDQTEVVRPMPAKTAMVFQEDALLPWLRVDANAAVGLAARGVGKRERLERVREWLAKVGLSGYERAYPDQLSGGMRQRAALARALVMDPRLLLLDEPLGALDEQTRNMMAHELRQLHLRIRGTMIMITHSLTEAVLLSDRVIALAARPGRIAKVLEIPLGDERDVDMVDTPEFVTLRHKLWSELQEDWSRSLEMQG